MKILLVGPFSKDDIFTASIGEIPYIADVMGNGRCASFAPHALAAVAAVTPAEHTVVVHDEQLRGATESRADLAEFDVVGISMIANSLNRTLEIAGFLRASGFPGSVAVGGPGTTNVPASLRERVDAVFLGEAEQTWPAYLEDLRRGAPQALYHQILKPDLRDVPPPRWEVIREDLGAYGALSVQTTRGCPYDCSFCDVIYIYGRTPRRKPVERVIREVRRLRELGARMILIADDNFGSDREYAKAVLRGLTALNAEFDFPASYITQADIGISEDAELLQLLADAPVIEVLVGVESPDRRALQGMNKRQNLRVDAQAAVREIQSYGIAVLGSMIVGADTDDTGAFERAERFVEACAIVDHALHPLMAPSGTKLWYDLKREGRLVELAPDVRDRMDTLTNIVPLGMSRVELLEGLADYWERVFSPEHYTRRALAFIRGVRRTPKLKRPPMSMLWTYRRMMFGILRFYLFGVERAHRRAFLRVMREARRRAPHLVPQMIFLHTSFYISHRRSLEAARRARQQAALERSRPDAVRALPRDVPVPEAVRAEWRSIAAWALDRLYAAGCTGAEAMELAVRAVRDFVCRFGADMAVFDDRHRAMLSEACDRAAGPPREAPAAGAPRRPPGYARILLDELDRALRCGTNGRQPAA